MRQQDPSRKYPELRPGKIQRQRTGLNFRISKIKTSRTYTRALTSAFEELGLRGYFEGNHIQRDLGYEARKEYLKKFNRYLYRLKSTRAAPAPA
jgi:hypothetical protein